jgi:hypothetical protein
VSLVRNKEKYLALMQGFISGIISVEDFEHQYEELWHRDRDDEWKVVESWNKRYDIELEESYSKGEISADEFRARWNKLFQSESEKKQKLSNIVDQVHSSLDVYAAEPDLEWEIGETELRREIEECIREIEELGIAESDDY